MNYSVGFVTNGGIIHLVLASEGDHDLFIFALRSTIKTIKRHIDSKVESRIRHH